MNWYLVLAFFLWVCGGWATARFIDPAALQLYIIISVFLLIITNLGERRGGRSAYSVFNDNCSALLGQIQAEQFDNEVRHRNIDREFHSPPQRRADADEHDSLLESTRREILQEQHKARRNKRVEERPRRRR